MDKMAILMMTDGCEGKCRIQSLGSTVTMLAYIPTFDKYGQRVGSDPNVRTTAYRCTTCDKGWKVQTAEGATPIVSPLPAASPPLP